MCCAHVFALLLTKGTVRVLGVWSNSRYTITKCIPQNVFVPVVMVSSRLSEINFPIHKLSVFNSINWDSTPSIFERWKYSPHHQKTINHNLKSSTLGLRLATKGEKNYFENKNYEKSFYRLNKQEGSARWLMNKIGYLYHVNSFNNLKFM